MNADLIIKHFISKNEINFNTISDLTIVMT